MDFSIDAIPMISTIMAQNKLMSNVQTTLLSDTLDTATSQMAELTKSMELSVNPNVGANFDVAI